MFYIDPHFILCLEKKRSNIPKNFAKSQVNNDFFAKFKLEASNKENVHVYDSVFDNKDGTTTLIKN